MEAASLATLRELSEVVNAKGYGRDLLYRDREGNYVFLRYWKSEDARRAAQEDPDMLRCWAMRSKSSGSTRHSPKFPEYKSSSRGRLVRERWSKKGEPETLPFLLERLGLFR